MKFNKLTTKLVCTAILLLAFSFTLQAKPGDLDVTFGNGGITRTIFPVQPSGFCLSVVADSALQTNDKIVVAGDLQYVCTDGGQREPMLARYNADGTLDATFGNGGIVTTRFSLPNGGSENGYFVAVTIQTDGKIIAAGYTQVNTLDVYFSDVVMARYNTDGSLDSTFGTGGKVFTRTGTGQGFYSNGNVVVSHLAIASDGSIYAVGSGSFAPNAQTFPAFDAIVIKYSTSGAVINMQRITNHPYADRINTSDAKLQPDGKLVFGIIGGGGFVNDFVLMRLNPDLTPDAAFGTNGVVITDFGTGVEQANGIVIDPDGKITVSGASASSNGTENFYAARYNANGSLDLTFGSGGKVIVLASDSPFPSDKEGQRIVRQSDGKYISAFGARYGNFGAIRLLPSGSLDPSFGVGGIALYNGAGNPTYPTILGYGGLILLQSDGKILLPGTEQVSGGDFRPIGIKILRLTNEATSNANPVDMPDFYVRQQYNDFLNRSPDNSGLAFWTNQITSCNGDAQCIDIKRQNVSAAFFLSREFQETGFFVIKLQRAAFGKISNDASKRITFQQFLTDSAAVGKGFVDLQPGADQTLDQNKTNYAQSVANISAFIAKYPTTLSAAAYVDALFATAGVTPQGTERQDAINAFGGGDTAGRAAALRKVAESNSIKQAEFSSAFVLLQYFGYLRRNPTDAPDKDDSGYQFWLNKLNTFNGDYIRSEMVRSFILSTEYRKRFGAQ